MAKVLIVEDDEDFSSILNKKFTDEGFSVVIARNGETAVEDAEKESFDLILSDILMPQMDGIEMARKIREKNSTTQILFLTNIKDTEYTDEIKKLANTDILIKSELRIGEIVEQVRKRLGTK